MGSAVVVASVLVLLRLPDGRLDGVKSQSCEPYYLTRNGGALQPKTPPGVGGLFWFRYF